jgi:hypothetical protein
LFKIAAAPPYGWAYGRGSAKPQLQGVGRSERPKGVVEGVKGERGGALGSKLIRRQLVRRGLTALPAHFGGRSVWLAFSLSLCCWVQPSAVPRPAATTSLRLTPPLRLLSNCHSRCLCLLQETLPLVKDNRLFLETSASVSISHRRSRSRGSSQPTPISEYATI